LIADMMEDTEPGARPLVVNEAFSWALGNVMPSSLIAALPPLPAELEYRLVGQDLVLIDVTAGLVVDILRHALVDIGTFAEYFQRLREISRFFPEAPGGAKKQPPLTAGSRCALQTRGLSVTASTDATPMRCGASTAFHASGREAARELLFVLPVNN
jgi:hypothetical protein